MFKITTTTGLAMFAMFFGSGNLVFPIKIGIQVGNLYPFASLGLLLTGVIVPFIGLISIIMYQGNRDRYFGLVGEWAPFTLSLLILSLLGPFGVVPRCIIVAYGGISLLWPSIPFYLFSAIFSLAIIAAIWQKNQFIPLIGTWLAPFKMGGIILIIIAAVRQSPNLVNTMSNPTHSIFVGLVEGYQLMDLLASFFFSITVVEYLRSICSTKDEAIKVSIVSSIIGASLIGVIYIGFIALGAYYKPYLAQLKPEHYLAAVANLTLGKYAALVTAVTMFLACLTTAASLSRIFAEFLRKDVVRSKISWSAAIFVTVFASFLLSLTGFANISNILAQILKYLYPALIVLSVTAIINAYVKIKIIKQLFFASIAITIAISAFGYN